MREIITATPQDLVETAPASWAREQIASGVYAGFENSPVPCGGLGRRASFFPVPGFVRECITVEVDEPETFGSFVRELITVEEDEPETFGSWSREEITTGVYAGFNNVAGGAAGRHAGFNKVVEGARGRFASFEVDQYIDTIVEAEVHIGDEEEAEPEPSPIGWRIH